MTAVLGEFLGPAGEHIAAAVSFRGKLPYSAQYGVVRQLDRLIATLTRYLADLPPPGPLNPNREPLRDARGRAVPARLALDRAAQVLRPVQAGRTDAADGSAYPVVGHLAAAADYLAAGRDLLHTHFAVGHAGPQTPRSYWAPVITSSPVSAAPAQRARNLHREPGLLDQRATDGGAFDVGHSHVGAAGDAPRRAMAASRRNRNTGRTTRAPSPPRAPAAPRHPRQHSPAPATTDR